MRCGGLRTSRRSLNNGACEKELFLPNKHLDACFFARTINRVQSRLFVLCLTHIKRHKVFQFGYIKALETENSITLFYLFRHSYYSI
jgi:hypothetical protein